MAAEGKVEKSSLAKPPPTSRGLGNVPHAPSALNFRQNGVETTLQRGSYHLQRKQERCRVDFRAPVFFFCQFTVF